MDERIRRETCVLCGSDKRKALRTVVRKGARYEIAQCLQCCFVYVTDPPADTGSHAQAHSLHWLHRSRHRQIRQLLLRHLKPHARVIDIGCGRGELGYIMRTDPVEYVGFEPARGYSEFARSHGVTVHPEPFAGQLTADAMVMDNVLEHVLHPVPIFNAAVSSLRGDGLVVVIVIVPNRNDVRQLNSRWRDRYHWIPPDHINYFTAKNVETMFRACGLQPLRFGLSPIGLKDYKYLIRGALEEVGVSIFGHNVYAVRQSISV